MDSFISEIRSGQQVLITELLEILITTNDVLIRNKIGFLLVDSFKSNIIKQSLVNLINDSRWRNYKGTMIFLLHEYTTDNKYLNLLIEILLKCEIGGEVYMVTVEMLFDLKVPFDKKEIKKALNRLHRERIKKDNNKEKVLLIGTLSDFLEGQKDIIRFYSRFGK